MFDGLRQAVDRYRDDPSLNVFLIRAVGRYFCAGVDIKADSERPPSEAGSGRGIREAHRIGLSGMRALLDEMEAIEKPFVAAHQATCLGGGLELSLSCDFRLAAEAASYGFPEGRFGSLPATGGVSRLTRTVGAHWARYIIMANRHVGAAKAHMIGLVHEVYPDATFEADALAFCRELAALPPEVVGTAKLAIELARDVGAAQARNVERLANSALMLGPDFAAAKQAYLDQLGKPKASE
jgi:enoyl-CoA hydratase/carnithine racemase